MRLDLRLIVLDFDINDFLFDPPLIALGIIIFFEFWDIAAGDEDDGMAGSIGKGGDTRGADPGANPGANPGADPRGADPRGADPGGDPRGAGAGATDSRGCETKGAID